MARIKQGVFSWEDVLAQRYQSNKPPPLRRTRRRSLSSWQVQPQCRLLSRLSPELRLMIWEDVLGGLRLHIIQRSGQRLGHVVCPLSATTGSDRTRRRADTHHFCGICTGAGIPQPVKEGDLARGRHGDMSLGLALTCRQIYHESIHLLYTLNTFEFSNPWSLPYLRPTLTPDHWDCIRAVELRWSFPGHWLPSKDPVRAVYVSAGRAQWLETCRALARLPALQSFVLVLGNSWFCEPVEKLPGFLEPLRGLRVQRFRGVKRDLGLGLLEQGVLEGLSSDEESSSSSSSSTSSSFSGRTGTRSWSSVSSYPSLASTTSSADIDKPLPAPKGDPALASWELRLQGQTYYGHELRRVGEDLRRRGIDCCISMV